MKHRIFIFSLFVVYLSLATALMVWQGVGIAPDRYAVVLLLGALLIRRTRAFLLDWVPLLFLIISYDFLRGFADILNSRVHYYPQIKLDEMVFGSLPTVVLQQRFYTPGSLRWYDILASILYLIFFAVPLAFAFLLWLNDRGAFRKFAVGISVLSYGAWATYLAFPAAPPWLAHDKGLIPGISKILDYSLQIFPEKISLPTIYHNLNPNPVAAIPSLHAAYPTLVILFALKFFKKKGLILLPYVLAVWVSVIYLGEHYVSDVIIGVIYAVFFYLLTMNVLYKFPQILGPRFPHNQISKLFASNKP